LIRTAHLDGFLMISSAHSTMKRSLSVFGVAFAVAAAWFGAVMLTSPPKSVAAEELPSVSVQEIMRNAPNDLPTLEADAI
jgi:hypothetical protein